MKLLRNRIYELRQEKNITQRQLADAINTTADSIYSWEKGRAEPSADFIIKIAQYFEVSTDYLLGIED